MSLDRIEQEEQDRIQFELQLAGQGGRKCKVWPSSVQDQGPSRRVKKKPGSFKVESSADYRLSLRSVQK